MPQSRKASPPKPATQAELARTLGLHQTTVSAILSGKAGASFSLETRQRVVQAAREIGYRPNHLARVLRHSPSGVIGIIHFGTILSHSKARLSELSRNLLDAGYQPYICDMEVFDDGGRSTVNSLLNQRPEGLILCGFTDAFDLTVLEELTDRKLPIVSIGEIALPGIESFVPDREGVFDQATAHMLEQGATRIGVTTRFSSGAHFYREGHSMPEAIVGYRRALRRKRIEWDAALEYVPSGQVVGSDIFGMGYKVGTEILEKIKPLPDGLACHNDLWALGIIAAFRDAGVRIPEDIMITGYGNEFFSAYLSPPLTSFACPVRRMAEAAAARILERLASESGEIPIHSQHLFQCELVIRRSSQR